LRCSTANGQVQRLQFGASASSPRQIIMRSLSASQRRVADANAGGSVHCR
jgi:hypothetical protein